MLSLQFVPYQEIESLGSARRVHKLLDIVKQDKVVVLQGRLKKEEEKDLIEITMENISDKFKGIELAVIDEEGKDLAFFNKIKSEFYNLLLGDRRGFTIIGPSSVVKEIRRDPHKIELLTDSRKKKRK
ncbi:DUF2073 domain-containing protein [Candidatus Woesearchaeota archaeon]|nr:DUF2073 domain-containing protein [Candidatus Woesearchaeota archaeon]